MRPIAFTVVLIGGILVSFTARSFAADEACTLLTQTQVSAALEVPVDAGTPIGRPSACQWTGKGRFATLTITQPLGWQERGRSLQRRQDVDTAWHHNGTGQRRRRRGVLRILQQHDAGRPGSGS